MPTSATLAPTGTKLKNVHVVVGTRVGPVASASRVGAPGSATGAATEKGRIRRWDGDGICEGQTARHHAPYSTARHDRDEGVVCAPRPGSIQRGHELSRLRPVDSRVVARKDQGHEKQVAWRRCVAPVGWRSGIPVDPIVFSIAARVAGDLRELGHESHWHMLANPVINHTQSLEGRFASESS